MNEQHAGPKGEDYEHLLIRMETKSAGTGRDWGAGFYTKLDEGVVAAVCTLLGKDAREIFQMEEGKIVAPLPSSRRLQTAGMKTRYLQTVRTFCTRTSSSRIYVYADRLMLQLDIRRRGILQNRANSISRERQLAPRRFPITGPRRLAS